MSDCRLQILDCRRPCREQVIRRCAVSNHAMRHSSGRLACVIGGGLTGVLMAALGSHIQALSNRYNEANVGRPDREMLYTAEPGGFAVGSTSFSSSVRAVYCTANPDMAVISAEWRLPDDSDAGNSRKVDLSVMVRDGKVVVSDRVSRYRDIDDLARFLLVAVFFPENPDKEPERRICVDEDEDEPF